MIRRAQLNAVWLQLALLIALAGVGAEGRAAAPDTNEILTFEFKITLPDYATRLAWRPDGRALAVNRFNTNQVLLVDVEHRQYMQRPIADNAHDPEMAWSPDGRFLALRHPFSYNGIRLLRTTTWEEVARVPTAVENCRFQHRTGRSLKFTADNSFLWISCNHLKVVERYLAAIKLRIPDLEVAGKREVDPPIVGRETVVSVDSTEIRANAPISSSVASLRKSVDSPVIDHYFYVRELETGRDVISPFVVRDETQFNRSPAASVVLHDAGIAVIRWTPPYYGYRSQEERVQLFAKASLVPWLASYSIKDGSKIAAWATMADNDGGGVEDILAPSGRPFLIGTVRSGRTDRGALLIWDPTTGRTMQRVSQANISAISLTQDERWLAAIVGNELHFYRVKS